jgi:dihydroorotase
MANTSPVNDDPEITRWMIAEGARAGLARVLPIAAVTKNLAGEILTDFPALRAAGAVAFSDDGMPIMNPEIMRRALLAGRGGCAAVITHAEDRTLACGGVMHAGAVSARLGHPGMPSAAESVMVERDCKLAAVTGAHLHVAHLSTAEAVAAVRVARAAGTHVTAEATPHHFMLADETVATHGTLAKMNPPLRTDADIAAVRGALADGTLDVIASDHAPHAADEKALPMAAPDKTQAAPFGIVGLETTLALVLALVHAGVLAVAAAIRALTIGPARALGIAAGQHATGSIADVTLIDPEAHWTVEPATFRSRSRNTPFAGRAMRGRAVAVCLGGRIVDDGHLEGRFTR